MAKTIVFDEKARQQLLKGVQTLSKAVSATLGPKGRNVAIEKKYGSPLVTKDGVTVAKEIDLKLQEKFPNAKVIRIKNFTKKDAVEITEFFNGKVDENTYGYQNNKYYHNEDGKCEALNENDAFQKIKTKI